MPASRYLVTGGRETTTVLTISADGHWELESGRLYDVTHLPCRAARYTPTTEEASPAFAKASDFPVTPGAVMPAVEGCNKQDYVRALAQPDRTFRLLVHTGCTLGAH